MRKVNGNLGKNVKLRLLLEDKSQQELADYLHVDESYVSKMLRGAKVIPATIAFEMADFFGCSVYDLVMPIIHAGSVGERDEQEG